MWRYFVRKLNLLVITIFLLTLLSFLLLYLFPGGPMAALAPQGTASPVEQSRLFEQYALEQGFWGQYRQYLSNILQGNWGLTRADHIPIPQHMLSTFFATLQLAVSALTIAILIGVPMGMISAIYPKTLLDKVLVGITFVGQSIPVFWWALMLILLLALGVNWFPISGRIGLLYNVPEQTYLLFLDILFADNIDKSAAIMSALHHMALPTLTIAVLPTTILAQTTRASLMDILEQNYIEAARSKGLSRWKVLTRHALPNYYGTLSRQLGALANPLLTSTMIVEVIFSWPGSGRWLVNSLLTQDIVSIQACMLTISSFVITLSIATDLWATASTPKERNNHGW